MITRSSKHVLKFSNKFKLDKIEMLFNTFQLVLQEYVNLIWDKKLPLKNNLSSKELPDVSDIRHSRWKQLIYKNASEIIRANIKKNKTSKPIIKNIGINLDNRFWNTTNESNEFDEFIKLTLPWFQDNKNRAKTSNIPIKHHKQSNKYNNWNRKNTIRLTKKNDNYFIWFIYEKEENELKINNNNGQSIGIDNGYKTLIATSNGELFGRSLEPIYENIARKKRGSINYNQKLEHRNNEINKILNEFFNENQDLNHIVIEDLKNVKKKTKGKIRKRFMNKLQYWTYRKVINKIEQVCQEKGILLEKVSPDYTSQTCSKCGNIDKLARQGELYQCSACGLNMNADINASINILHRGVYSPSNNKPSFHDFS